MIVGEAHVIVRAITTNVKRDIVDGFRGAGSVAENAGQEVGQRFQRGLGKSNASSTVFDTITKATAGARQAFDALLATSYTLGPLLTQLVGGISALIGALGALAGMAAGAVPSIAALGGAYLALGQAFGVLKLAFSGVGAAIQAGQKATSAAVSGNQTKKDLTSYIRRVKDTRRQLERVIADSNQRIADSIQKVRDAEEALAETDQENARKIVQAKQDVEEAQLDLNKAYEDGYNQIKKLQFDAEDAALAEKRAALELDKARETLLRTQDLPPNSRARREAELAYAQADLNYRRAVDTNKDMAKEQDRLAATGVDGTDEVIRAKKKLAAQEQQLQDATREAAQDHIDGLKKVNDAIEDQSRVEKKAAQDIADAKRDQARAEADLEKARKKQSTTAVTALNNYKNALAQLSPEQQDFVKFMVNEFIPATKELKAAAGKEFFPKLIIAMREIKDDLFPALVPLFTSTGGKLGKIAEDIAAKITSDKALGQIKKIWDTNDRVIKAFGDTAVSVISIILRLLVAIGPLTERFVGWIRDAADAFDKFLNKQTSMKQLQDFFKLSGDIASKFGDIAINVFQGLNNIILGLMQPGSGGWRLLDWFDTITQKFADWTATTEGKNRVAEYFKNVADNAIAIAEATGPFLKILAKMGEDKNIQKFAETMKGAAPYVESVVAKFQDAGPAIANFIVSAVKFFDLTTDTGAIQQFWSTLQGIADVLIKFFSNPVIAKGFAAFASFAATMVALRLTWTALKVPVLALANPLAQSLGLFQKLQGAIGVAGGAGGLGSKAGLLAAFSSFGPAASGVGSALVGLAGPVGIIVLAVAGLVAAFVAMWNESETFRKAIQKLVDGVIKKAVEIFNDLKKALEDALEPILGSGDLIDNLKKVFKGLGDFLGTYVIPVLSFVIGLIMDGIGGALKFIIGYTGVLIKVWKAVWDAVWAAVEFFVTWFQNTAWPIISKVLDNAKKGFQIIADWVRDKWQYIQLAIKTVVDWFQNTAWPAIKKVLDQISTGFAVVRDTIKAVWDRIIGVVRTAVDTVGKILKPVWDVLSSTLTKAWGVVTGFFGPNGTVANFVRGLGAKITSWASGMWNGISVAFKTVMNGIIKGVNVIISALNTVIDTANKIKIPGTNYGINISKISPIAALAQGGVVNPKPGGTLAVIGEAGRPERVEPLDANGLSQRDKALISFLTSGAGAKIEINVHPSQGMDEVEIADIVSRRLAFALRTGG